MSITLTFSQALGPIVEKLTETVGPPDMEDGKPTFIRKRWSKKTKSEFMEWLDAYLNDRAVARALSRFTPPRGSGENRVTKKYRKKLAGEMDFGYFPVDERPETSAGETSDGPTGTRGV